MKKSASILAAAAVIGFSALTATPANAVVGTAYPNCPTAAAAGVYNIPAGSPDYAPNLDSDGDGIGCEKPGVAFTGTPVPAKAPVAAQAPVQGQAQVAKKPIGAAPTGVAQETDNGMGFLALGGLVAAGATGTAIVRRRMAVKA